MDKQTEKTTATDFAKPFDNHQARRAKKQHNLQSAINTQLTYQDDQWPSLSAKLSQSVLPKLREFNRKTLPTLRRKLFTALDQYKLRSPIMYSVALLRSWLWLNQVVSLFLLFIKAIWYYLIKLPIFWGVQLIKLLMLVIARYWKELALIALMALAVYGADKSGIFDSPPPTPNQANPNGTNPNLTNPNGTTPSAANNKATRTKR